MMLHWLNEHNKYQINIWNVWSIFNLSQTGRKSLNNVFANQNQSMMQYTFEVFKYLQKVFYITNCLISNVTTIIQIKIKYCRVISETSFLW